MQVEEGKVVALEYTITTDKGELIESSAGRGGPLTITVGPECGLLPAMLEEIKGLSKDEEADFDLPPERAFGTIDSGPTMPLPKNAMPEGVDVKVGSLFEGTMPGTDQPVKFIVTENLADQVIVRLIHPLAGKTIHVHAKILDVEEP
jgi:FKBP-type peptidyl-prolyl cis-trans isomerase 2